jgi:hypothetical protein
MPQEASTYRPARQGRRVLNEVMDGMGLSVQYIRIP